MVRVSIKRRFAMSELIKHQDIRDRIIEIRGERVLLDRDVAELYGVETKHINQALLRNPEKFPDRYIITLESNDWDSLRSQFVTLETNGKGQHTKHKPKAFTEKGLYMLATILKSPAATQTTIAIVETFAKLRELTEVIYQLPEVLDEKAQEALIARGGEIFAEIIDESIINVIGNETSLELNLGVVKVKHTTKWEKRKL